MKHPHHDVIVAWAEGKPIQYLRPASYAEDRKLSKTVWDDWTSRTSPCWDRNQQYRIKPEPRTAIQIYTEAAYPDFEGEWSLSNSVRINAGLQAVINAVKSGELK